MTAPEKYRAKLDACLARARAKRQPAPPAAGPWIDRLAETGGRAAISVALTSLLKKAVDPGQDVRKHRAGMDGGYSGRSLDRRVTTPFLRENGFPATAESGWLARSLGQNAEYTLDYPGAIKRCKGEFLRILDAVEEGGADAAGMIAYLLQGLSERRGIRGAALAVPSGLAVRDVAGILEDHFSARYAARGAERLPALAVRAAYRQMLAEVGRYRKCTLGGPGPRAPADRRTGPLGDVEVRSGRGDVLEAIEVRHGEAITAQTVRAAFERFKTRRSLERYYILTTRRAGGGGGDDGSEAEDLTSAMIDVSLRHGCQVVVNGVVEGLRYYLRLLRSTDGFVQDYVALLEDEPAIAREHREMWNRIVRKRRGP